MNAAECFLPAQLEAGTHDIVSTQPFSPEVRSFHVDGQRRIDPRTIWTVAYIDIPLRGSTGRGTSSRCSADPCPMSSIDVMSPDQAPAQMTAMAQFTSITSGLFGILTYYR